jgi:DNA-binding MarR family transcriptional regulator
MRGMSDRSNRALFFRLKRAHHQLYVHASRTVGEATGAQPAQVSAVVHLAERDGITLRELGEQLALNSAGITGLVARLERDQLVRRVPSSSDGRAISIRLTARGRTLAARVAPLLTEISEQLVAGFTSREVAIIERFLDHITTSFGGGTIGRRTTVRR